MKTNAPIVHRAEQLAALKTLAPFCRAGAQGLYELAWGCPISGWKELLIRFWQQQARCAAELEEGIRELGGDLPPADATPAGIDAPDDSLAVEKQRLLRSLNQQTEMTHRYAEVLKIALPFNVRAMLQRHQKQIQEIAQRLIELRLLHLAHPPARDVAAPPSLLPKPAMH